MTRYKFKIPATDRSPVTSH